MYLGITLNKLKDFESACAAFEKAIELDQSDWVIFLNYGIILYNNKDVQRAKEIFHKAEEIYSTLEEDDIEPEMVAQRSALAKALNIKIKE